MSTFGCISLIIRENNELMWRKSEKAWHNKLEEILMTKSLTGIFFITQRGKLRDSNLLGL